MNQTHPRGQNQRRVCLLISGGLDSCVLSAHLAEQDWEIIPLYVRTGLLWEPIELIWMERFLACLNHLKLSPLKQISLPVGDIYQSHWSTTGNHRPGLHSKDEEVYLPGRNLILLSKATLYCALNQLNVIALGPLKSNPFPDSTAEFFAEFQQVASRALDHDLEIMTPFSHLSKVEVIKLGDHLPLELTFSCISPVGQNHCGTCNKCAERRRSFASAFVQDRTHYDSLPDL